MNLVTKSIISAFLCLLLGSASGFSTFDSLKDWYPTIVKPSWNPPNWIFGPVWTILYILMGISFARIWHSLHIQKTKAIKWFGIQLSLNLLWTPLFFGAHSIGWAFVDIVCMLIAIGYTVFIFYSIDRPAGLLMIPYLLWVSFATMLNGTIWYLNS